MTWPEDFINKIICGDCLEVMKEMPENSIDAVVTDPPYGLEFMGKEWDQLKAKGHWDGKRGWQGDTKDAYGRYQGTAPSQYKAGLEMQLWHTQWLTEAYRVLKPGGSMLVMGGTRTSHRLACAIEDSGFIIKDTLMWLYGSGFPKAQDLGKMIDKRAKGNVIKFSKLLKKKRIEKGYSLAEADVLITDGSTMYCFLEGRNVNGVFTVYPPNKKYYERIVKIFGINGWESIVENNLEVTGKGEGDFGFQRFSGTDTKRWNKEIDITKTTTDLAKHWDGFKVGGIKPAYEPIIWAVKPPEGSYVDNVLKWGVGAVNVDECRVGIEPHIVHGKEAGKFQPTGGATIKDYHEVKGRFPANVILDEEAAQMLDEQGGTLKSGKPAGIKAGGQLNCYGIFAGGIPVTGIGDSGGASRFFYCAKASKSERGKDNKHPTVKPISLFMWLLQLVTREGQVVLDPFIGSGTTMLASQRCNRKCMGIEKEQDYCKIAEDRLAQGVL